MPTEQLQRCSWANGDDALMAKYHDEEWGVPQRDPRMLWEMLMLEGFQAGLSWRTILHKREAFRKGFAGFDPRKVARFGEKQVAALLDNPGIVRSRAKIEATIAGAKIWCDMQDRGEDFAEFCWSFTDGKVLHGDGQHVPASTPLSTEISRELRQRGFNFVGPVIVYAWMQAVGIVEDHAHGCFKRKP
ncbi:DNA-3-methyladenine glycosylase I [Ramlibacter sp. G-1-2-2]|uniref:DNA-3-methyladenine glycosylase I n=1 Tax=Ramlibacter agri TaxID=2728837 RepID=A0A848HCW4_9BURK|nr:DNA-3-methyladenine glycosylase I [Ramlibacter agri]NML47319.1 DNA-3-methyladenine glycosylase I [Ramlibacter agri]